jgi:hypothetical protein
MVDDDRAQIAPPAGEQKKPQAHGADHERGPNLAEKIKDDPVARARFLRQRRRASAKKQYETLQQQKAQEKAQRIAAIDKLNAAWARRHDMNYTPDAEQVPPSFWHELKEGISWQIVEPLRMLGRGIVGAAKQNAKHTQEIMDDAQERGMPMTPIGASMAAGVTDTVGDVGESIEECKADLERLLEAETKTDKAIAALNATYHFGKAALGAYALADPLAAATDGGGGAAAAGGATDIAGVSAGGEASMAMGGDATATAGEGAGAGAAGPLTRLTAGLNDDVGNPTGEDKSMQEGEGKEQQKREKKDARDAEHDRPGAKSEIARHLPPAGPAFQEWFDGLSVSGFEEIWADPAARKIIEANIRHPGGLHEWLQVAEAQRFKQWNVTMETIQDARTLTSETVGKNFKHGGVGSGTFHRQTRALIQSAPDFESFLLRLNDWADENLFGGRESLPPTLVR